MIALPLLNHCPLHLIFVARFLLWVSLSSLMLIDICKREQASIQIDAIAELDIHIVQHKSLLPRRAGQLGGSWTVRSYADKRDQQDLEHGPVGACTHAASIR